ncbi:serine carboxypeptidase-like 17 [Lactuca sativa]|uniref:serine carboxypeptidase-like 17 n=1 Tax=Lactuca sativa TaxID=4236 RepID=UPI000CA6D7BE|nr:serine carboxypeptidase-like 17 [Lactuca sativa]
MKPQSQYYHLQPKNHVKKINNLVFSGVFLLVISSGVIESQSIVKTLPGFVGDLPFILETGYIGVGESNDVQWFYYFVESEGNPEKDPLMLWLTAGPGCSALTTLVSETGPIIFNKANSTLEKPILEINPDRWIQAANILYLDQPAGAGFSYAKTPEAYTTNDTLSTMQIYDFLKKWLVDHPKFLNNPFYLGGDSYNGILVPMVLQEIYNGNEVGEEPQIKIKGYMLGNPLTDRRGDYNSRITFAHRVALLSDMIYESAEENCHGEFLNVDPKNSLCMHDLQIVYKCIERINKKYILDPVCDTSNTFKNSHLLRRGLSSLNKTAMNMLLLPQVKRQWCRGDNTLSTVWANQKDVRKALRINEEYDEIKWVPCNESLTFDYGKEAISYTNNVLSSVAYHKQLTYKNCRALIYSGDHDMVVPYVGTLNWIESINLILTNDWRPWFVDKQVAGYTMKYSTRNYNLTFATIKGGGHITSLYKPKESLSMVIRWLSDNAL